MYKITEEKIKVFIGHPGGPFYKDRDEGCWDFPKGEVEENENLIEAAEREFEEETGIIPPKNENKYISLGEIKNKSCKNIHIWAFAGDFTGLLIPHSQVTLEFPRKSGKIIKFPEIDRAGFFSLEVARKKLYPALIPFLDRLEEILKKELK